MKLRRYTCPECGKARFFEGLHSSCAWKIVWEDQRRYQKQKAEREAQLDQMLDWWKENIKIQT